MKIQYEELNEFGKDVKKLRKKIRTLLEDLEIAKRNGIELFHIQHVDNGGIRIIEGMGNSDLVLVCKMKKFACRSLKGRGVNTGIRIIYVFFPKENKVVFLEMYFKADKENENRERIAEYLIACK